VVELDSWHWHGSPAAFRGDRTKSRRLTTLGWTVARIAGEEIDDAPTVVARDVLRLIDQGLATR
jgi:very-short-patch-repair endonuclease